MNTTRAIGVFLCLSIPFLLGIGPPTGGDVKTITIANTTGVSGTSSGGVNPILSINLSDSLQSISSFADTNAWPYQATSGVWGKVKVGTGLSFSGGLLVNTYPTGHLAPISNDTISSSSTLPLNATTGPQVDVTGTASITATDLVADDSRIIRFTGAAVLVDGTNLALPGHLGITTGAGDWAVVVGAGSGHTTMTYFQRANGFGSQTLEKLFMQVGGKIDFQSDAVGSGYFDIGGGTFGGNFLRFSHNGDLILIRVTDNAGIDFDTSLLGASAFRTISFPDADGVILLNSATQTVTNKSIDASQLTGTIAAARLPNPTSSSLGGVESYSAVTHQWINAISTVGIPASTQPDYTDLKNGLTGDVTVATGASVTVLANIPSGVPAVGTIVHTNISAPSSPASGKDAVYSDSIDLRFHDKNASGVIGTTVVADTGASHNFLTAISAAGAISKAQPAVSDISGFGTGVATALGNTTNGTGGFITTDGTATLTGKTYDASATGNVFKAKSYIYLSHPHLADGTNATIGTSPTSITYGHATFSNSVAVTSNYVEYYLQVPEDIDTTVALRARIKVLLGNTDTGSQRYVISSVSVADSAGPTASTLANAINIDFAGDASGANGDVETSAWTTLTSWAGALTAGQTWRIRLGRDGNSGSDTSTVNSTELGLVIEYGVSQ